MCAALADAHKYTRTHSHTATTHKRTSPANPSVRLTMVVGWAVSQCNLHVLSGAASCNSKTAARQTIWQQCTPAIRTARCVCVCVCVYVHRRPGSAPRSPTDFRSSFPVPTTQHTSRAHTLTHTTAMHSCLGTVPVRACSLVPCRCSAVSVVREHACDLLR